ncbi:ABC transporter substrate-binding protein [Peptoniphilus sp.]|jgi:iron(III) transport system substrate-binding protein|uniref:ABC transporter substrate-binding protein n=1 Tax=Peptoniphilus sp. TaxID=1971214 RepID=UPI003D9387F0
MKRKLISITLVILAVFALTSCGSNKSNGSENKNANKVEEDGEKLSGKVTVYVPSPAGLADNLAESFTEKTGVEVEQFQGTTGEILARLEAEESNPVADVVILASWSDGLTLKSDGKLESYELKEKDNVNEGFIDSDNTLFGSSASAVGVIYNKNLVPELDADWGELADPKYKDMIAIPDPEKSGAAKDFLAGFVTGTDDGDKILEDWANNGLVIPGANKAALEAVTTGEKAILIAGVDYNAYSSIDKGEPLEIYYPKSGTVINPRPAMILKTAPNMENAKAFVDFLFSDEAQELVADAYLLPASKNIEYDTRSNLKDIPVVPTDWDKMMSVASDTASRLKELCK